MPPCLDDPGLYLRVLSPWLPLGEPELGEEPPTCEVEHVYDRGQGRGVGVNLNVSWHSQTEIKLDTGILGLSLGARLSSHGFLRN